MLQHSDLTYLRNHPEVLKTTRTTTKKVDLSLYLLQFKFLTDSLLKIYLVKKDTTRPDNPLAHFLVAVLVQLGGHQGLDDVVLVDPGRLEDLDSLLAQAIHLIPVGQVGYLEMYSGKCNGGVLKLKIKDGNLFSHSRYCYFTHIT